MRRFSWRRAAALVPVAALGLATVSYTSPAGAADPPEINVGNVTIIEGNGGVSNTAKFPITLSEASGTDTFVEWTITPGSADAGTDYVALKKPKTTKVKAGKTAAFASVKVLPDGGIESDETFTVTLNSVTSGTAVLGSHAAGTGTIVNDDSSVGAHVSVGDAAAVETDAGQPKIALPFTLSTPLPTTDVYINWVLTPGTATENTDFKGSLKQPPKPKKTKIKAGKTNAQATITAYGDIGYEPNETFTVNITSLTLVGAVASVDVARNVGTGTIINDDPSPNAPDAPTNVVASLLGDDLVGVDWDAPATGPAPDGYTVEVTADGGENWSPLGSTAAGVTELQTNLEYGTYQFRVYASNGVGNSPYAGPSNEVTVAPPPTPDAPSNVVASLLPGEIVLIDWDAATTGPAPDSYSVEVTANAGGNWAPLNSTLGSVTELQVDLDAGTYQFRVTADNAGGSSPYAGPSNAVTVLDDPCNPFCNG